MRTSEIQIYLSEFIFLVVENNEKKFQPPKKDISSILVNIHVSFHFIVKI